MIPILEQGTPMSKERSIGHPSIPPRVFGPSQYLVMLPVQMIKLKLTLKPLPAQSSTSKLVPPKTQSDAEDCPWIKLVAKGNARRLAGADAALINNFVQWFHKRGHLGPLRNLLPLYSLMWEMMKIVQLQLKQLQLEVM